MQEILFEYNVTPTTWAYLSALLTIGIYFKFRRFWSVRNLDLLGLISYTPGLLLIFHGLTKPNVTHWVAMGYWWLAAVGALFVFRLFLDSMMVRRPLLEPNLNASGLTFTGAALFVFLAANVIANRPPERLEHKLPGPKSSALQNPGMPHFQYLATFVAYSTEPPQPAESKLAPSASASATAKPAPRWTYPPEAAQKTTSRLIVLISLAMLIAGMVLVGYRHFDNIQTGVAAAALYLLLPYAGQMTSRIDHVVPGALLVWMIAAYRRPALAGLLGGAASGLIFYPLFLLPLWSSFYWRRGWKRFLGGFALALVAIVVLAAVLPGCPFPFAEQMRQMFGLVQVFGRAAFAQSVPIGLWQALDVTYRIPVMAVFAVLTLSLTLWPAQKNLGTLLSCTAAVMLGSQFWHLYEGGLYMAWFLPLLVLTIFRPNLEDRVASSAVIEGRGTWVGRLLERFRRKAAAA
jgi:hypothetical protein